MPSQKTIDDFEEKQQQVMELVKMSKVDHSTATEIMMKLEHEKKHLMAMMAQEQKSHMEDALVYGMSGMQAAAQQTRGLGRGRRSPTWEEKLCMRMGWDDICDIPPGIRLSIINSGTAIFLTIVTVANDEVVTLKDEPAMFPSDQIVTQLRMLANG